MLQFQQHISQSFKGESLGKIKLCLFLSLSYKNNFAGNRYQTFIIKFSKIHQPISFFFLILYDWENTFQMIGKTSVIFPMLFSM